MTSPPGPGGRQAKRPGPVAAPDPRVWSDPTRRRVLEVLATHDRPVPLGEVAAEVGGHPNTTRGHLEVLREAGLVHREPGPRTGRGRPPWVHGLTEVGRSAVRRLDSTEAGPGLDALAMAFVRHLGTLPDPSGTAREVGRSWAGSLGPVTRARTPRGRAGAAVEMLDGMGFTPVRVGRAGGPGEEVELRSCPLLESASAHPEVVCQIHLGLVEGALVGGDGHQDLQVDLEPWGRPSGCRLRLSWDAPGGA